MCIVSASVTPASQSGSCDSRGISSFKTLGDNEDGAGVPEAWYVNRCRFWNLGSEGVVKEGGTMGTNPDLACFEWIQFKILEYGP